MDIPEEKVYSVRLKRSLHQTIMERLESGVSQRVITAALIHYFASQESQSSAQLDQVMTRLDEIRALIKTGLADNKPELPHETQLASPAPVETDPLADDVAASVYDLLNV
ncbi:hypothetical protein [Alicyclobacillus sp. SO9]|uniref:hypothetical protein n=1 Tax=Alicyclobacillus sp. SO9 TaxID=2665646 RepID=UPI0018E8D33E|nr:hypothetical protein [Alicyclobacillus sp. SO9]QQE79567.1 hypothetical protein GI364_03460 [Alicyclobacillus sp. SO9]